MTEVNGAYDAGTPPRRHGVVAERACRKASRCCGGPVAAWLPWISFATCGVIVVAIPKETAP